MSQKFAREQHVRHDRIWATGGMLPLDVHHEPYLVPRTCIECVYMRIFHDLPKAIFYLLNGD